MAMTLGVFAYDKTVILDTLIQQTLLEKYKVNLIKTQADNKLLH